MGRKKIERTTSFIPLQPHTQTEAQREVILFADETEALFLIDYQGLYQAEAAKKMEVSRTTLSRIIKNARRKLTEAALFHKKVVFEKVASNITVALFCDSKVFDGTLCDLKGNYIILITFNKNGTSHITHYANPISQLKEAHVGKKLLPFFETHYVNFLYTAYIGNNLKHTLTHLGTHVTIKDHISLEAIRESLF